MAVPKRKVSHARKSKLRLPKLVACPNCGELHMPHRACPACGQYDGRTVIAVADEQK